MRLDLGWVAFVFTVVGVTIGMPDVPAAGQDVTALWIQDPDSRGNATASSDETAEIPAIGVASRTITLPEALELAGRDNLDARRAVARTQVARGEASEARLAWIPALSASAGIGRTDGQVQGSFGDFREVDFDTVAPFGRLSFGLNPGQTALGSAASARRAESVEAQERAVRRLVLVRTAQLYHELVRERASVVVSHRAVQDTGDLLSIAEVLVRQGMGRGDDLERARAELAGAEQRLLAAERRFHRASINLATALDLDPSVMLVPGEEAREARLVPREEKLDSIQRRALESRPEIAAARRLVEARRAERGGGIARLASPTIEAFYQAGATGEQYGELDGLTRSGVSATWTFSASGLRRVRTVSAQVEEASLALEQAEEAVRADVAAAWADLRAAEASIGKAREAREAAEAALRISQVRFRNGTSLAIEVLQAQQALEQARLSEVTAVAGYNQAQVELRAQMGPVSPADLAVP